jgi:hypothetical protein
MGLYWCNAYLGNMTLVVNATYQLDMHEKILCRGFKREFLRTVAVFSKSRIKKTT